MATVIKREEDSNKRSMKVYSLELMTLQLMTCNVILGLMIVPLIDRLRERQ